MQIDLVSEQSPSGGYENKVTALDLFSRHLSAYSTANEDDKTVLQVFIDIRSKDAYLPAAVIAYKGSAFVSQVIREIVDILGGTPQHSTAKYVQTIEMLERLHDSLKTALNTETDE